MVNIIFLKQMSSVIYFNLTEIVVRYPHVTLKITIRRYTEKKSNHVYV